MAREIERKFLVVGDEWRTLAGGVLFRQGYLSTVKERTVRVRRAGERGTITVKGVTRGIQRLEFEYPIPVADADAMLDALCERPIIEKLRYRIPLGAQTWEVDDFLGDNRGLVVAEIELGDPAAPIVKPSWIGEEISHDPRYFNANLVAHPYRTWGRR